LEEYNIGDSWGKEKYKMGSVSDNNLNEKYERFEFKGEFVSIKLKVVSRHPFYYSI